MKVIKNLLYKQKKFSKIVEEATLNLKIKNEWSRIIGNILEKELKFSFIRNNCVHLLSKNPCWRHEIIIYESKILENINKYVDIEKQKVFSVKIHIKKN